MDDPEAGGVPSIERWQSGSIADFLAFWLATPVLAREHQAVFDHYYRSYKRHFGPYLRHWYARQTAELTALIRAGRHASVLEVGCGCGTESLWAALNGARVTAIDISRDLLAVAQQRQAWMEQCTGRTLDCRFLDRSILETDDLAPFDIVYMEQAFHHLEPRAEVVRRTARLVSPGGRLIIAEANGWNPLMQIKLFALRGVKTVITREGRSWGHERVTVPAALIRQFGEHGLERESLDYYRALPNARVADTLLWLDRRLPAALRPLFTHFNLVLRKSES
jgi:2-polyprenyl-3-methyl-5-hydroxy-6-metoxy-1,4-benzoquinol methylase